MSSSCTICINEIYGSDGVATPCGHVFHTHCVLMCIANNKACPECRRNLLQRELTHLNFAQPDSVSGPQSELRAKVAELNRKKVSIFKVDKVTKFLNKHRAQLKELRASTHQKYLDVQQELDPAKRRLLELETKSTNLANENAPLKRRVQHFGDMRKILQGTQREAEEVLIEQMPLLTQEVGKENAMFMIHEIALLKRKLGGLNLERGVLLTNRRRLMCELGQRKAELQGSGSDPKQQLKDVDDSPVSTVVVQPLASTSLPTPVTEEGQRCVTEISVDISLRKENPHVEVVVTKPVSNIRYTFKRKINTEDVARIGNKDILVEINLN